MGSIDVLGGYLQGSGLCIDCLRAALAKELCPEEVQFLLNGADGSNNFMYKWPHRVTLKQGSRTQLYEYVYDDPEHGDLLYDQDVYVKSSDWIYSWEQKHELALINSLEESVEDEICDDCGETWKESDFRAACTECYKVILKGQAAIDLEKTYKSSEILCASCYYALWEAVAFEVQEKIEHTIDTSETAAEWQVEAFVRAVDTMYFHDIVNHYGAVLTLADAELNTTLQQCYNILMEALKDSELEDIVGKEPVHLFLCKKDGDSIYEKSEKRQVAPVKALTRTGLEARKVNGIQLKLGLK